MRLMSLAHSRSVWYWLVCKHSQKKTVHRKQNKQMTENIPTWGIRLNELLKVFLTPKQKNKHYNQEDLSITNNICNGTDASKSIWQQTVHTTPCTLTISQSPASGLDNRKTNKKGEKKKQRLVLHLSFTQTNKTYLNLFTDIVQ